MSKNKITIAIATLLSLIFAISLVALPAANAHTPPYYIVSYAYITAAPQPVGEGQTMTVSMWVDYPLPGTLLANNIRRGGYTLTITAPDGKNTTQNFATVDDPTGIKTIFYTPTQAGNYTFTFDYTGQTYIWNNENTIGGLSSSYAAFENDTFSPATATLTVTVQAELVSSALTSYPLPTEYWTRPIEGQNTDWWTISSNWLAAPYVIGQPPGTHQPGVYQSDGTAPNSAHILWTKPIQYGGVAGGSNTAIPGEMFYTGNSYNARFRNPIIMYGTLYYEEPYGNSGGGGDYVAVDLQTGEELWRISNPTYLPSFGYLYAYESPNQYGVLPNGLLIAQYSIGGFYFPGFGYFGGTPAWAAYDPRTGELTSMNITNIPSGSAVAGPQGEYLKYVLSNYGNATNPNWYLAQWNSSRVFGAGEGLAPANWYSGTVNASLPSSYDWNVSVDLGGSPTGWSIGTADNGMIPLIDPGNIALMIQGTFGTHTGDVATITTSKGINLDFNPANITAISLNPQTLGQVLWRQSYPQAPNNVTRTIAHWDPSTGVFIFEDKETVEHWGYSLSDGTRLWGPVAKEPSGTSAWNYQSLDSDSIAYGNLYFAGGYSGIIYCYNDTTGDLEWTFGNGGEGNSTNAELYTAFGVYPLWMTTIADGKLYLAGDVHSPNSPLWKGQQLFALNATDGTLLWSIFNYANNMYGGITPVADGILVALNNYDSQIYAFGKGPSATTVEAPMTDITLGSSLVIRGTVTDISAGTNQAEQAARFPFGVPAVSDKSMSAWMEYVYMQKPRPTDTVGVNVTLSVLDSNGNYRDIGIATSDANGFYSFNWKPDIPGKFTVYASFDGSESYWPSHTETAFAVDEPPVATPMPTISPAPMTDAYVAGFGVALLIILVAGIVVIVLMLRRR